MSKLPAAGNTVQTLQAKLATEPAKVDYAAQEKAAHDRLTAAKERVAAEEAAKVPTASATHPPTGPAPVTYKAPINAAKSTAGPAPSIVHTPVVTKSTVPSAITLESRVDAIEERLNSFNTRSGQKI